LTQTLYEFGEFDIDCARFELRRNGPIVKLEHIPMEFHILLAEKDGSVVTRQGDYHPGPPSDWVFGGFESWMAALQARACS
jgi:hypothetical protein